MMMEAEVRFNIRSSQEYAARGMRSNATLPDVEAYRMSCSSFYLNLVNQVWERRNVD